MLSKKLQGAGGNGAFKLEPFSAQNVVASSITVPSSLPNRGLIIWHTTTFRSGEISYPDPEGWTSAGADSTSSIFGRYATAAYFKKIEPSDAGTTLQGIGGGGTTVQSLYIFKTNKGSQYTLGGTEEGVRLTSGGYVRSRNQLGETPPYINISTVSTSGGSLSVNSGIEFLRASDYALCEYNLVDTGSFYPDLVVTESTGSVDYYNAFQIQVS